MTAVGVVACAVLASAPFTTAWWRWIQGVAGPVSDHLSIGYVGLVGLVSLPVVRERPRVMLAWLMGVLLIGIALESCLALEAERLHITQYSVVGVMSYRAMPPGWSWRRRALLTVAAALGLAVLEEGWQEWLPDRVGQWSDVLLDGLGGLVGCYVRIPWASRHSP